MAIHFSILAWELPGMEEPGGLQSMGSQRVEHDCVTSLLMMVEVFDKAARNSKVTNTNSTFKKLSVIGKQRYIRVIMRQDEKGN